MKKFFFLTILILLIFQTTDFMKNSFFLLTSNYETRFNKNYEYCGNGSLGFLNFLTLL